MAAWICWMICRFRADSKVPAACIFRLAMGRFSPQCPAGLTTKCVLLFHAAGDVDIDPLSSTFAKTDCVSGVRGFELRNARAMHLRCHGNSRWLGQNSPAETIRV
jgi:hypothetical protein